MADKKLTEEDKLELLLKWWDRDDTLTPLTSTDEHNKNIMFNINRANKAIGTMLNDLNTVQSEDLLGALHREKIDDSIRSASNDDIYKFRESKTGGALMQTNFIKEFLENERKQAEAYLGMLGRMSKSADPDLRKVASAELKRVLGSYKEAKVEILPGIRRKIGSFISNKLKEILPLRKKGSLDCDLQKRYRENTKIMAMFFEKLK